MFYEFIGVAYIAAIVACFIAASARPRYRGALIALGVVLLVPAVLFAALALYLLIALSNGVHLF
jgi:hypothetical protein